jgi:gliding motility-associated-like protein
MRGQLLKQALLLLFCIIISQEWILIAQPICSGSVGENIFLEGDFGSGTVNIPPDNPNIAPGFIYTTNTPIDDGYYNITNGTDKWLNNYATWLDIGDNSPDPFGYMMVVNASFTPGIFYDQEVQGLCDNTNYVFTADIINMIRKEVTNHILPNVSFLINDEVIFTTGAIPQDELWHTYGFAFDTEPGETTLKLTLRNNAPGGIGNDLALDNITFKACGPDAIASTDLDGKVCENSVEDIFLTADITGAPQGSVIQWQISSDNGETWSDIEGANDTNYQITDFSSGYFLYRYLFANSEESLLNVKCRTISTPQELEVVPLLYSITDTVCEGTSYFFGNEEIFNAGVYKDSLISSIGCDSIVTLNLFVVQPDLIDISATGIDPSCTDFMDGQIFIDSVMGAGFPVEFYLNGQNNDQLTHFDGLSFGNYQVQVIDRFGCSDEVEIMLQNPPPFVGVGSVDTTIRLGQIVTANPTFSTPAAFWEWSPTTGVDCPNCENPMIQPFRSGIYEVQAQNEFGCKATYTINFNVNIEELIFIPNVFTPNGDMKNDYFGAFGDQFAQLPNYQIEIYDRWGGKIYSNENAALNEPVTGWDGKINGQVVEEGVYSYKLFFTLINSDVIRKVGTVTVFR